MALGFRHRDDLREVRELLALLGIDVHAVAPLDACAADLARIPEADFNVVMYPELAGTTADWLGRTWQQPRTHRVPIGVGATTAFIEEVAALAGVDPAPALAGIDWRARWYARSVDSTYLTGKRVFVFGDATHAVAAARIASREMGFTVVGLGTYSREQARDVREAAAGYGLEPIITDDYLEVERRITEAGPELVLGTQMERHVAKRLGLPCAVISAPVHVQDFPARHAPQMGIEGANVMFDAWVLPLMMGLEEHLLTMFRDDFEFSPQAAPSHLGAGASPRIVVRDAVAPTMFGRGSAAALPRASVASAAVDHDVHQHDAAAPHAAAAPTLAALVAPAGAASTPPRAVEPGWAADAERELHKVPFFVRGKARRNTERFARDHGVALITVEILYDAKAHFSA
jgi:light-independent protochlorophyllide reductase subunit B